jgi:hypothetical protein
MRAGTGEIDGVQGQRAGPDVTPPPVERILRVGSLVFLFTGTGTSECKYPTRLLGWRPGRFLLVGMPQEEGRPARIPEGAEVILRYVLDGEVYGLRARAQKVQFHPAPLLFLEFPKEIENVPLRSEPRVPVRLPAVVSWLPGRRPPSGLAFGYLRDLAADGGLIEMPLPEDAEPLDRSLHLTFSLGTEEEVRVNAVVRNHTVDGGTHRLGIAFHWTDLEERDRVLTFCRLH